MLDVSLKGHLPSAVRGLLVFVAYVYERIFGRFAAVHLCVAEAMRKELKAVWGVDAIVLYDKAPKHFQLCDPADRHDFFSRNRDTFSLENSWGVGGDLSASQASAAMDSTLFTTIPPGNRPDGSPLVK